MNEKKTGIFFDGCHTFMGFEALLGNRIRYLNFKAAEKRLGDHLTSKLNMNFRFTYQGWFEGLKKGYLKTSEFIMSNDIEKLRETGLKYHNDRQLHWALIEAGIEPIWLQKREQLNSAGEVVYKEKGVDTALVVSALRRIELFNLEVLVVFTNDKDFEPFFHNVRKDGTKVITIDCTLNRKNNHSTPRFVDNTFHFKDIFSSNDLL